MSTAQLKASLTDLCVPRLESPTRSLLLEAPKGIQILAEAGDIQAICRNELRLESKDGEVGLQFSCFHLYCTGYTG